MDVIEQLEKFNKEIQKAESLIQELQSRRIDWCRENKKEIKKLYPVKGKIYQIVDIENAFVYRWRSENLNDDVYFFKPDDVRFMPNRDFYTSFGYEKPTVKGVVLDCNLKQVDVCRRAFITNLKEVNEPKTPKSFTKIYVMIDKNTGYYKIGRSKNPEKRERTLQSEKPTIEMLFNRDARVKDEKELHNMFSDKRVRGEWFDLNGSDLSKIKKYFNNKP